MIYPDYKFIEGSTLDLGLVEECVIEADAIIHLARPLDTQLQDSVLMMAERHQKRIVALTSLSLEEANGDSLLKNYCAQKNAALTLVRLARVVGVSEENNLPLKLLLQAKLEKELVLNGSGEESCHFSDVMDVVQALYKVLLDQDTYGELLNLRSSEEVTLVRLGEMIRSTVRSKVPIKILTDGMSDFGTNIYFVPKSEKLKKLTGFRYKYKMKDTLSWIYSDYKMKVKMTEALSHGRDKSLSL